MEVVVIDGKDYEVSEEGKVSFFSARFLSKEELLKKNYLVRVVCFSLSSDYG